jgi:ribonuclease E
MYHPVVQLQSGGYLVINPTEALVSIDINSGRSTREHNIEQTAFATNLEAASEIARQLRLRDMAGLVVIDFIDMEQSSHVRKVEKAMKDALRNDRARIQVGRISSFGLLEMSRQRLRTGVLEASTRPCAHCEGTGLMRTAASAGLSALRMIEDEAARGRGDRLVLRAGREAAIYLLNKKRHELGEIEQRYGVSVEVLIDEGLEGARMSVESSGPRPVAPERIEATAAAPIEEEDMDDIEEEEDEEDNAELVGADEPEERAEGAPRSRGNGPDDDGEAPGRRRRRRRRGGRGRGRREHGEGAPAPEVQSESEGERAADGPGDQQDEARQPESEAEQPAEQRPKRRRSRKSAAAPLPDRDAIPGAEVEPDSSPMVERPLAQEPPIAKTGPADEPFETVEAEAGAEAAPRARRRPRARNAAEPVIAAAPDATAAAAEPEPEPTKSARKRRSKTAVNTEAPSAAAATDSQAEAASAKPRPTPDNDLAMSDEGDGEPRRGGWWQRTFG